jgi:hypothetical protein
MKEDKLITRSHAGHVMLYSLSDQVSPPDVLKVLKVAPEEKHIAPASPTPVLPPDVLVNDITKKVALDYDVQFKKDAVREISQFLNDSYQKDFKTATLKQAFKMMLQNHNRVQDWKAYIEYFINSGQLEKISWGHYRIIHATTIPKKKETLGVIDELFPDEKDNA